MKARRLPGVRCSTLKTVCNSLLCLMIMPGRIWVAGIAILKRLLTVISDWGNAGWQACLRPDYRLYQADPLVSDAPRLAEKAREETPHDMYYVLRLFLLHWNRRSMRGRCRRWRGCLQGWLGNNVSCVV